jgi:hypothetical protein
MHILEFFAILLHLRGLRGVSLLCLCVCVCGWGGWGNRRIEKLSVRWNEYRNKWRFYVGNKKILRKYETYEFKPITKTFSYLQRWQFINIRVFKRVGFQQETGSPSELNFLRLVEESNSEPFDRQLFEITRTENRQTEKQRINHLNCGSTGSREPCTKRMSTCSETFKDWGATENQSTITKYLDTWY